MKFICTNYHSYKVAYEGGYITFKNHEYETDDNKKIELLKTISDIKVIEEEKEVVETKKKK